MPIDDDNGAGTPARPEDCVALNTDTILWVEPPPIDTPFAPQNSIHVTQGGGIGMQVGGHVIVMPLREWHALALRDHAASLQIK